LAKAINEPLAFTADDDFGIKIVWVKVKVEKSDLSWKNFPSSFFSFVDVEVWFCLLEAQ
jgi:hypothetical protein